MVHGEVRTRDLHVGVAGCTGRKELSDDVRLSERLAFREVA